MILEIEQQSNHSSVKWQIFSEDDGSHCSSFPCSPSAVVSVGGATNGSVLIARRAVQGIGSGGLNVMIDVIVSDLVPLRERGNFMAMVLSIYSLPGSLGWKRKC